MAEPYSDAHAAIAIEVLTRAHAELVSRGLTEIEGLHALAHAAIDWMGEYCCADCLETELGCIADAALDRIEAIPVTATARPAGAVH